MPVDIRAEAARFYDSAPEPLNDAPFYQALIATPDISILELGCGTGRVTLPLVPYSRYIHGIDLSSAMLSICREKLLAAGIDPARATVEEGDITDFDLGRTFDLIIAPFRVMQNLETDGQVDGLFRCMHRHLAPGGTCILNVFRPYLEPDALRTQWCTDDEVTDWETPVEGGKLVCSNRRTRMDAEKLVLYPELIYRRYEGDTLAEERILKIAMRCYYPDTFERTIVDHGFRVVSRWGGYSGEPYGKGPELVVQFAELAEAAT